MFRTELFVRVHPNSVGNEVVGVTEGRWQVRVAAPPVKGKANKELIAFLSRRLDVGKSQIVIVKGHTARNKVLAINGLRREDIVKRLSPD